MVLHSTGHEHYNPQREHNAQYDHEAFLGEDQAHEFDTLTPAESKRRLGLVLTYECRICIPNFSSRVIADKVDTNNDGVITKEELMAWITHIARRYNIVCVCIHVCMCVYVHIYPFVHA